MGLFSEIKYVVKVFLKAPAKFTLIKKSLSVLKKEGISGLKYAVKATGQMQEELKDLYEKQQSVKKEYKEYSHSVLFIIWALQEEGEVTDTYRLIVAQMKKQDHIIVIKTEEKAAWEEYITCEKVLCSLQNVGSRIQEFMMECKQDYVYFIKAGNDLAPNMRDEFAEVIGCQKPAIIYSDECTYASVSGKIVRYDVKPDFSEYDICQGNQSLQSVMFTRELLKKVFDKDVPTDCMENMMLYLMLNAAKVTKEMLHLDKVLLLKKDSLEEQNLPKKSQILERYLNGLQLPVRVIVEDEKLRMCVSGERYKASIIILAEHPELTKHCVEELRCNTVYKNYELLVIGESSVLAGLTEKMERDVLINVIPCESTSTYTNRCNIAARKAMGDILIFMQEDMRVQNREWLSKILNIFVFPQVGGVSPKVIREDGTIRYAGMIAGGFGFTPIPFNGESNQCKKDSNMPAFFSRQISVLSASCIAVRKDAFKAVGGFDEVNFTDKFSNAQISFALMRAGYACIFCADCILVTKGGEWYDSWYMKEHPTAYLQLLKNYGEELSEDAYFTESMKCLYLRGVPIDFRIYQKKNNNAEYGKKILMISHDSLLGGATIAFQYAARVLKKNGYYVTWLVQQEGAMLDELEKDGIGYIVDSSFKGSNEWLNYAKNFDLIICSTILLCPQVELLKNIGKSVVWWVHEAKEYYDSSVISKFTRTNLGKLNVWCGGTFAEKTFQMHFADIPTEVMVYGVPDYATDENIYSEDVIENIMNKMIFLSIGTIESRKGQDILAEAIRRLDSAVRDQCLFVFIGKAVQKNVYEKVQEAAIDYPESVVLRKPVNRNILMQMYRQSDVVLCTSREDPMPVFMTECMMQSKIAICSENTGTAGVLTDGYDGFIYYNNSVGELAEKITYVFKNKDNMKRIKENARKTYEEYFSMEVFEEKLHNHMKQILGE